MAIDRIPGVGPANSDIASAIATTPAVSAQITANVPTAAAIATAVAAPSIATITSAITTNAASAGVTMAAITSSITTNAASAGVTLAAIGTQVANNAPSPNAWTVVSTIQPNNTTNTYTFSSLSGYKAYKLVFGGLSCATNGSANHFIRLNGDSGGNYIYGNMYSQPSTVGWIMYNGSVGGTNIPLSSVSTQRLAGDATFERANLTGSKAITIELAGVGGNSQYHKCIGSWYNTAAITSITVATSGANYDGGFMTLYGAN
jgi:hypothetical protein